MTQISASRRTPVTHLLINRDANAHGLGLRWLLILSATSFMLLGWLVWRYGMAADSFAQLPQSFVESLNLLTFSSVATVGVLWVLLGYQRRRFAAVNAVITPSIGQLQSLSPAGFEQFSAELFRARGYTVRVRGRSGDLGVDLEIVNSTGKRAIAQCKRYRSTVGPDVVRELYGTMIHERVAHAFLITTADISDGAHEWAAGKPMTLIDGGTLIELAENVASLR